MNNNSEFIEVSYIEVTQPIGTFYVGRIESKDLLIIADADIRRIEKEENGEIESYYGIQRELSQNRVKEISKYVNYIDATFPSSIVLSVKSITNISEQEDIENISVDINKKVLKIRKHEKVANIIDGQHRIFGIKEAIKKNGLFTDEFKFDLIVTIFIDIDVDQQSMIFATINKAQTKVNKSLVYDLFDLAKTKSPQRTVHNIVRLLNEKEGSPFKDRIKMLGKADDPQRETVTQATLVESILRYVSKEPMLDRDRLMKKKKLDNVLGKEQQSLFFRNWFISDQDEKIAKTIWNYFSAISTKWPAAWEKSILSKSTGIISFMKFLKPVANELKIYEGNVATEEEFMKILEKVTLNDDDFTITNYAPSAVGHAKLYKDLLEKTGLSVQG